MMNALTRQQRIEMLDSLLAVAMGCPVDDSNPFDCPLHPIRKMELPQRIEWFYGLTDDDVGYLASYHRTCLRNRLEIRALARLP